MVQDVKPFAILCLWEYDGTNERKPWKFVEVYGVDQDGYACTKSQHASGDRHSYLKWMHKKIWYDKATKQWSDTVIGDEDDNDWKPIPGRAVTVWTTEGGVRLAALNPPSQIPWLSESFCEELIKNHSWYSLLQDGHTLYMGTARRVEDLLEQLQQQGG